MASNVESNVALKVASVWNGGEFNSFNGTIEKLKAFGDRSLLYLHNQGVLCSCTAKICCISPPSKQQLHVCMRVCGCKREKLTQRWGSIDPHYFSLLPPLPPLSELHTGLTEQSTVLIYRQVWTFGCVSSVSAASCVESVKSSRRTVAVLRLSVVPPLVSSVSKPHSL